VNSIKELSAERHAAAVSRIVGLVLNCSV
ncbi:hypothetical protein KIPB_002183, partial [Kipferlia bialata]